MSGATKIEGWDYLRVIFLVDGFESGAYRRIYPMKITNKELLDFVQAAREYESRRDSALLQAKGEGREVTKFDYALGKVLKKALRKVELFNEKQGGLDIEFCDEDDKGAIMRDERGMLKFKKEGLRKRNQGLQNLGNEEVELEPHIVKTAPSSLTVKEMLAFDGLVINVEEPPENPNSGADNS